MFTPLTTLSPNCWRTKPFFYTSFETTEPHRKLSALKQLLKAVWAIIVRKLSVFGRQSPVQDPSRTREAKASRELHHSKVYNRQQNIQTNFGKEKGSVPKSLSQYSWVLQRKQKLWRTKGKIGLHKLEIRMGRRIVPVHFPKFLDGHKMQQRRCNKNFPLICKMTSINFSDTAFSQKKTEEFTSQPSISQFGLSPAKLGLPAKCCYFSRRNSARDSVHTRTYHVLAELQPVKAPHQPK